MVLVTEPTITQSDDHVALVGFQQGSYVVPATLDDLLPVVERIADALEAQVRPNTCDEKHATGAKCILDDRHVGHHVTADGRYHWLDDD